MKKTQDTGKCQQTIQRKVTRGVMGKGTESFATRWDWCPLDAVEGAFCKRHAAANEKLQRKLELKRKATK